MNIEGMIRVVCDMVRKESGVDIEKAATITDAEIKDEILRRVWDGERIYLVLEDCKKKYVREFINFREKSLITDQE